MNDSVFDTFPELETERLKLRAPRPDDAEAIFAEFADPRTFRYSSKESFTSLEQAVELLQRWFDAFEKKEGIRWVLEEKATGKYVGSTGFWRLIRPHFRAEIGYDVHPDAWGKGFMTEALLPVLEFGFKHMGLHSLEGNVDPRNIASARVLEKTGFIKEGHFRQSYFAHGEFTDTASYSLLSPYPFVPPAKPQ